MKKFCPRCSQRYDDGTQRFCLRDGALLSLPDSYRLVGAALDDKYRIDALVGLGGFGAVYSAWHLGLDRQVAFKILQPNVAIQAPEAVALFEGEAKTAARLHHENIVVIHDAGRTADGLSYIAMEWLEGRPLDEELRARGRLSFERTAAILRQTASALAHAHAHRTVHRDLKPGSVMLVGRLDGGEQVKVVDFGIAKVLSSSAGSMVSRSIGTPAYASPEQWQHGAQIDGRADIYSLGVMLYEMLAGSLPFRARSVEELIQLKLKAEPPPLARFLPDAPAALDELLRRMMAVDPASRPQKVGDIPALFDAACKSHSDLLEALAVAEATERMRQSEIERIVAPPPVDEVTRPRPPAPEPPREQRPVERVAPKPEVVGRPPLAGPSRSLKRRAGRQRWVAMTSFLNLYALVGIAFYGPPYFYDFMVKEFGWSREQVTSGNTYGKTLVLPLFGFLAGWIIDRFGLRRLMIVGIVMGAISIIGLGQVDTLPLFYACFIFNALGYVCAGPLPNQVLLSRWFQGSRGKAMGFAYLGIGLGGAITVKMAAWLTGRFGWQTALLWLGLLMIVVAIPLTWMVDDKSDEFQPQTDAAPAMPLGEILRSPSFYLLALGSLCSIGAVGATNQHMKLYLTRDSGFAQNDAANVIALVLLTSNIGRILMGWLADRFPKKYVMILIYLLVAAGIPLLFFIQQPGAIYLFAIVFGIGMGGDYMIIPLMAAELFGVRVMGRVMGLIIVADGLAEAWVPKLVGRLRDQNVNYTKGFALMITLALIGALAVSLLPRKTAERVE